MASAQSRPDVQGTAGRPNRREFIAAAGAAGAFTILDPRRVRGAPANAKIRLGLIGCGGRGNWIAELFNKHGGYEWVAGADYFEDRVNAFGDKFGVPAGRRYTGLSSYRKLIESQLDAIVVESPPYFHPEHAAAGVTGGKHVYLAKPIAVDVPGCATIGAAAQKATEKKLVFLVDFQTRASALYREAIKRVHNGDIGKLVNGEAVYYTSDTWGNLAFDAARAEERLRNWGVDKLLSGDIITEQNIHALDVATWIVDEAPRCAVGCGGRKARTGTGNCNDHFAVIYTFPDDVIVSFVSRQYGKGWEDIGVRMFGGRGMIDTHYFGAVSVKGDAPFAGGELKNLYEDGAVANIADFHACITEGRYDNATAAPSVRSNLTTILGRTAAYQKQPVTWEEMMKANAKVEADLRGLKT
jgi:myo-inositol 2-dehydrogenase / D-chiro-inositol 1-dehydrogenase